MIPAEKHEDHFTEDEFPSQAMLGIRTTEDYLRFRAKYIEMKNAGSSITVPVAILTDTARQAALQPVYIYTPENFPRYKMLKKCGTRYLERGAYNWLRGFYLGQPFPRQGSPERGRHFMEMGMTWPQAFIAGAIAWEGGDCPAPDDMECMARSPYRQITEENFPPYALLQQPNANGVTPERYAEIRRRYLGSYAPRDVTEHVMDLMRYSELPL